MMNPMSLNDKNIMVTGASSGIGKSIAIFLSKMGANVIMVARNEERLKAVLKELGPGNHSYFLFDLGDPAGIGNMMDKICSAGLKLNGLVHSAGISKTVPIQYLKLEDLNNIMSVNFYSFIELTKQFSRHEYGYNCHRA